MAFLSDLVVDVCGRNFRLLEVELDDGLQNGGIEVVHAVFVDRAETMKCCVEIKPHNNADAKSSSEIFTPRFCLSQYSGRVANQRIFESAKPHFLWFR